jgi:hypothetical protein
MGKFVDNLVIIAKGKDQLELVVKIIERWAEAKNCENNKSKMKTVQMKKNKHNYAYR